MNCTSAINAGIAEAVLEYAKAHAVKLPHVSSPSADRVSSTLMTEAVTENARSLYHNALERDMELYYKLLPPEHRPAVEDMVSKMLAIGRNWVDNPKQSF